MAWGTYHPPQCQRSPAAGRVRGAGLHRWACATAACFPVCWLQEASALEPGPPWAAPPSATAAGPRCSPGASGPGGKALQGNRRWGCPRSLEVWAVVPGTCPPSELQGDDRVSGPRPLTSHKVQIQAPFGQARASGCPQLILTRSLLPSGITAKQSLNRRVQLKTNLTKQGTRGTRDMPGSHQ